MKCKLTILSPLQVAKDEVEEEEEEEKEKKKEREGDRQTFFFAFF